MPRAEFEVYRPRFIGAGQPQHLCPAGVRVGAAVQDIAPIHPVATRREESALVRHEVHDLGAAGKLAVAVQASRDERGAPALARGLGRLAGTGLGLRCGTDERRG